MYLKNSKIIVIKVGSSLLIDENKKILNQIAGIEVGEVMAWNP